MPGRGAHSRGQRSTGGRGAAGNHGYTQHLHPGPATLELTRANMNEHFQYGQVEGSIRAVCKFLVRCMKKCKYL